MPDIVNFYLARGWIFLYFYKHYWALFKDAGKLLENILVLSCLAIKLLKINQSRISWRCNCSLPLRQNFLMTLLNDLWIIRFSSLTKGSRYYSWSYMIAGHLSSNSCSVFFFPSASNSLPTCTQYSVFYWTLSLHNFLLSDTMC